MCNTSCLLFAATSLSKEEVEQKKIIEVGSYDVNGSVRPIIELWKPAAYIGVDIEAGPGVDIVCRAEDLVDQFGSESFDAVISTELLEHVKDWKKVVSNMKTICKRNGIILITTRSRGFGYHGHPYDFWRYELSDVEHIFCDCIIEKIEKDRCAPGVFIKAQKPEDFVEKDLTDYELYSIVVNKRVREIDEKSLGHFRKKYLRRQYLKSVERKLKQLIFRRSRAGRLET